MQGRVTALSDAIFLFLRFCWRSIQKDSYFQTGKWPSKPLSAVIQSGLLSCSLCHLSSELLRKENDGLLKLPTDKCLIEDPSFRRYVELYAKVSPCRCCKQYKKDYKVQ